MKQFMGFLLECRDLLLEAKESSMNFIFQAMCLKELWKKSKSFKVLKQYTYEGLSDDEKRQLSEYMKSQHILLKGKLKGFSQHERSWIIQEFTRGSILFDDGKRVDRIDGFIWPEDFSKVSDLVIIYNKLMKNSEVKKELKNDLMKYTYDTLRDDVKEFEKIALYIGTNKGIYNKDGWVIYKLEDYEDSMKLIGNNQNSWCIKERENFEERYQKPFYVFFKKGKPYACSNLQIDDDDDMQFYLKDIKDHRFQEIEEDFGGIIYWLLIEHLKLKGLHLIGDLEALLLYDIRAYSSIFTSFVLHQYYSKLLNYIESSTDMVYKEKELKKREEVLKLGIVDLNLSILGVPPLFSVVGWRGDNNEYIELLIKYGADINLLYQGYTPLYKALVTNYNIDGIRFLLSHGADVNKPCESGTTPLMKSIDNGNFQQIKLLLEFGADVTITKVINTKVTNISALTYAVQYGNAKIFALLLNHVPKNHEVLKDAFILAISHNDLPIVKLLLNHGITIDDAIRTATLWHIDYMPIIHNTKKEIINLLNSYGFKIDGVKE